VEAAGTSSAHPVARGADDAARVGTLPREVSRYVLFDHIGRGGMADIFLARMRNSLGGSRLCVIKEILPRLSRDERFAEMLTREAKLAAQLSHANVVQVFDLGRDEGLEDRLFIAMEYVEGFDLNQLLRQLSKHRVGLPADFALFIIRESLKGLDYAHRARDDEGRKLGLVHRDVSPSNVLISFEGEVKLCDFGIARAFQMNDLDGGAVASARVAGKSAYMSPEHARGDDLDARADVFAAGILLWELCAGRRLYKGSEDEMLAMARAGEVPPLPDRGLPDQAALQAVLDRALTPERQDRFESAKAMLDALEEYAMANRLMASPLRFASFLTDRFAEQIVAMRRANEKAAEALDEGADFASFGPSSAPPPPAEGVADFAVPKAPSLPKEMVVPEPAEAEPSVEDDGDDEQRAEAAAETAEAPAARPSTRPKKTSTIPPPPEPFSKGWYVLLAVGCAAVFALVYFFLR
jgi:serine/threonine protein kinase